MSVDLQSITDNPTMDSYSRPTGSVRRVAIVGTGTIGSGWAAIFVAKGFTVSAYGRSEASEKKFVGFLQVAWRKLIARSLASDPEGWKAVKYVRDLETCVGDADYVQASVVEEMGLKRVQIEGFQLQNEDGSKVADDDQEFLLDE